MSIKIGEDEIEQTINGFIIREFKWDGAVIERYVDIKEITKCPPN